MLLEYVGYANVEGMDVGRRFSAEFTFSVAVGPAVLVDQTEIPAEISGEVLPAVADAEAELAVESLERTHIAGLIAFLVPVENLDGILIIAKIIPQTGLVAQTDIESGATITEDGAGAEFVGVGHVNGNLDGRTVDEAPAVDVSVVIPAADKGEIGTGGETETLNAAKSDVVGSTDIETVQPASRMIPCVAFLGPVGGILTKIAATKVELCERSGHTREQDNCCQEKFSHFL